MSEQKGTARKRRSDKYQSKEQPIVPAASDKKNKAAKPSGTTAKKTAGTAARKPAAAVERKQDRPAVQTGPLIAAGQNHRGNARFGQNTDPNMRLPQDTPQMQTNYYAQDAGYAAYQAAGQNYPVPPAATGYYAQNNVSRDSVQPGNGGQQMSFFPGYGYTYAQQQPWNQQPPPVQQANQVSGGRGYHPVSNDPPPKKKGVLRAVIAVLAGLALTAALVLGGTVVIDNRRITQEVEAFNNFYCNGVYVDGIHLGGMTRDEALKAVTDQARQSTEHWLVKLTFNGTVLRQITSADLNMTFAPHEALESAWLQGHTGTDAERHSAMEKLRTENFHAYTQVPSANTSVIDEMLDTLAAQFYVAPADAELIAFDPNRTYPFIFKDEVIGQTLNTAPIKTQLYQMVSEMTSGEVILVPTAIQPNVTVEWLKNNRYALRGTGITPISTRSAEGRNDNIRLAFSFVNGMVIDPGKKFSFNGVVGERTISRGFQVATEYVYNEPTDGVGGGVCQASSTIYLAAVRANLKIDKREPHSMAVNYTEYGKDATVYWYSNHKIDLVFTNNTEYPIYLTAAVQSQSNNKKRLQCCVSIYGQGLDGVTYDIVTEETVIPAPVEVKYVRDKTGKYVTYTDEEHVYQEAADGASVQSWRVKYYNGAEVSREPLYLDIYKEKQKTVYVGVKTRPTQ